MLRKIPLAAVYGVRLRPSLAGLRVRITPWVWMSVCC